MCDPTGCTLWCSPGSSLSLSDALQFDWHWSVSHLPICTLHLYTFIRGNYFLYNIHHPTHFRHVVDVSQSIPYTADTLKLSRVCPWKVLHVLKLCMGSMMMSYMTMSLTENKYFKIFHILLVQRCWCGIWPGQCPLALCYPDQCPPWLGPAWLCLTEMCNKTVTNH